MALKLFKYFFFFFKIDLSLAFDHVCYRLLYGYPSLGCKNVTLNMFAIIFFYLIINFNVMFSFSYLFYSKSVIYFHQREIAIVLCRDTILRTQEQYWAQI